MLSWLYRKACGESLADRQVRKLGQIDRIRAKLHDVENKPIINKESDNDYVVQKVIGFEPPPPKKKGRKKSKKTGQK